MSLPLQVPQHCPTLFNGRVHAGPWFQVTWHCLHSLIGYSCQPLKNGLETALLTGTLGTALRFGDSGH